MRKAWVLVVVLLAGCGAKPVAAPPDLGVTTTTRAASQPTASTPPPTTTATTPTTTTTTAPRSEADDVEVADCHPTGEFTIGPKVKVTNHSSKRSNYLIDIAVETNGGATLVGTASAAVNGLEPGQTTTSDALMGGDIPADATCRVAKVERYAA